MRQIIVLNLYQTIRQKISYRHEYNDGELITFLNPYSYLMARKSTSVFSSFDKVYIDGMVLVLIFRIFVDKLLTRNSFDYTSIGKEVLEELNSSRSSLFVIGTTVDNINRAVSNILEMYPSIDLIGYRHGYFDNINSENIAISEIINKDPKYLIVGMGTPMQERFLVKLKEMGWKGTGFTCGGFLHQSAINMVYYPKWIDRLNMRWIYRIWDEPKLIRRYFLLYPIAIYFLLTDIFVAHQKKNSRRNN